LYGLCDSLALLMLDETSRGFLPRLRPGRFAPVPVVLRCAGLGRIVREERGKKSPNEPNRGKHHT
jgi:hypothetical protein